ncbi:MAG: beta-ketoacyl synthase N-terminal-like domain-containing protein [Myxococcota bacterium]|nr:beta-ketoacyl synthase N-terminal-like domain-containing protein [Myxococcota bacterium]
MREISISGVGLFSPAGVGLEGASGGRPGEVPGFRARAYVEDRKSLKLMSRAVKLGVSGVRVALANTPGWEEVPPQRRAMYVGTTPLGGENQDLLPALDVSTGPDGGFELDRFASEGYRLIHPLWLVKGLSNNILGFACATHDFQGTNACYCQGRGSGLMAVYEGCRAVAENRADLAIVGGADSWLGAESLLVGRRVGEGAAFFAVRERQPEDPWWVTFDPSDDPPDEEHYLGVLGAARGPVGLARQLLRGESAGFRLSRDCGLSISSANLAADQ